MAPIRRSNSFGGCMSGSLKHNGPGRIRTSQRAGIERIELEIPPGRRAGHHRNCLDLISEAGACGCNCNPATDLIALEHSGLRWNVEKTAFEPAATDPTQRQH